MTPCSLIVGTGTSEETAAFVFLVPDVASHKTSLNIHHHEGLQGEQRYSSSLFNFSARGGVGGQCQARAAVPLGITWYTLYRRLDGPQGWPGWVRNISLPLGVDPQTVLIRCTDYAMLAHNIHHHERPKFHIYNFFTFTQFAL